MNGKAGRGERSERSSNSSSPVYTLLVLEIGVGDQRFPFRVPARQKIPRFLFWKQRWMNIHERVGRLHPDRRSHMFGAHPESLHLLLGSELRMDFRLLPERRALLADFSSLPLPE